jgi:UrcA family protein
MSMSVVTNLSIIVAIAALPFAAANATDENRSIRVRTNGINISGAHGKKILALRIDRAARELCDFANDRLDHQIRKIERQCRDEAKASAWASVETDAHLARR